MKALAKVITWRYIAHIAAVETMYTLRQMAKKAFIAKVQFGIAAYYSHPNRRIPPLKEVPQSNPPLFRAAPNQFWLEDSLIGAPPS